MRMVQKGSSPVKPQRIAKGPYGVQRAAPAVAVPAAPMPLGPGMPRPPTPRARSHDAATTCGANRLARKSPRGRKKVAGSGRIRGVFRASVHGAHERSGEQRRLSCAAGMHPGSSPSPTAGTLGADPGDPRARLGVASRKRPQRSVTFSDILWPCRSPPRNFLDTVGMARPPGDAIHEACAVRNQPLRVKSSNISLR
jgi:hypothetical protein